MPMDGVTLDLIRSELSQRLVGGRVDKIVQPERDEIILTIRNQGENMPLLLSASAGCARAHISHIKKNNPLEPPMLCMLLRKYLLGGRLTALRQLQADRILAVDFEHLDEMGNRAQKTIIAEFMGRHSNLIFLNEKGRIIESARRVTELISSVREVLPGLTYELPPAHGKLPFDALTAEALQARLSLLSGSLAKALADTVSGLSMPLARELALRLTGDEDAALTDADTLPALCANAVETLAQLRRCPAPAILRAEDGKALDILAFEYKSHDGQPLEHFPTISEAMDVFYRTRDSQERIKQKSQALHRVLKNNIERCEKKLSLQNEALLGSQRMDEYRIKGELLTASIHLAKKGMKQVQLPNYYDENMAEIAVELDEKLSPGQNAQRYFKLYQKARSAQKLAAEQKAKTAEELAYLEGQLENLSICTEEPELFEIRQELEKFGYVNASHNRRQIKQLPPSTPMRFTAPDGTIILVGKNNLQNDKLTFTANPDEWWLHAKDMPGSHVIVVNPAPSEDVLRFAAALAARFSKGGSSSRVPVDYTQRKYVKKPSGAKPGFVIYTHQHTVYAQPAAIDPSNA